LKGLKISGTFPSGNARYYYRRTGAKDIPLVDAPINSPKFLEAYVKATKGERTGSPKIEHRTGTIGAAMRAFLASDHYLTRAASTRLSWKRFIEEFERVFAKAKLSDLRPQHIRKYLGQYEPHPANNRLKVWRAFCKWSVDAGLIESDPARDVRSRATPKTGGFTPWTTKDVEMFRTHWSIGTSQRLALELMLHAGAAIGDAVKLGPGNIKDGWLTYRRSKSGTISTCPITAHWPDWFPGSAFLLTSIELAPRALTFLCTSTGKPRSPKAATQWFARAAKDAGLSEGKTAHGIRKHLAVTMAERGATPEQRMAILGHDTTQQTQDYSKTADARRIISGTKIDNSPEQVVNLRK